MELPIIFLKTKKDQAVRRFHPWIFSGAIKSMEGNPKNGDIVRVLSNKGSFLGMGHYSQGSIAVRIFSFEDTIPELDFWIDKLKNAFDTRRNLGFLNNNSTDIYRLVHAEGDGFPGLIVDIYGDTAVVQAHSAGMHEVRFDIAKSLQNLFGDKLKTIYYKSKKTLIKSSVEAEDEFLFGDQKESVVAKEYDCLYRINWVTGQKTGFFIDQRENRELLGQYSKGKKVLNTFCYSGGFSINAMRQGADEVHSLDSSQLAMDLVEDNIKLNNYQDRKHKSIKADAVDYLKELGHEYDIIVLDPPAFAKSMKARYKAEQGYKRINSHAIRQIKPGGLIFTFSCSQAVDKNLFNSTIRSASINIGRKVRILHQLHQPADHPINIFHPESEYLKGLVLQVD